MGYNIVYHHFGAVADHMCRVQELKNYTIKLLRSQEQVPAVKSRLLKPPRRSKQYEYVSHLRRYFTTRKSLNMNIC